MKPVLRKIVPLRIRQKLNQIHAKINLLSYRFYKHKKLHRETDYFVVSFPKSGRTWLRTLLGKYFEFQYDVPFSVNFQNLHDYNLPSIRFSHQVDALKYHKNKKAIILVRDPRDTIVSHYHQLTKRNVKFSGTISEFIRSRKFGINNLIAYMNKLKEYAKYPVGICYLSYEHLHENAAEELKKLLQFMELQVDETNIQRAVSFSQFENMQKMESQGKFKDWRLKPTNPEDISTYKVRKGKIGNYKNELSKEDIDYINKEIKKNLNYKEYT